MNEHTRSELNAISRERKIPYYYDLSIHELRVKLGLERTHCENTNRKLREGGT